MRAELEELVRYVKQLYPKDSPVPLHAPRFLGREKEYLANCIDTTYVSYVGEYVTRFEEHIARSTGIKHAIAMVNGTAALQIALQVCGLNRGQEVITQALTFVASANAITHAGGVAVFVDVDRDTLGMSPEALARFLGDNAEKRSDGTYNRRTGNKIFGVVPMHTFGLACRIHEISAICQQWNLTLVEDCAESLGTTMEDGAHTGVLSLATCFSFNGNKPITTGGGGMLVTNDDQIAARAKHISTTAKRKHPWEFFHDELGWNYRLPNINAAVGCAQMEYFDETLMNKRETARLYAEWGRPRNVDFVATRPGTQSNFWLNALVLHDESERDEFLKFSNANGIQTRPIWVPLQKLPMYATSLCDPLENTSWLESRIVNIPSSVRI